MPASEAATPERELVEVEVDQVAALDVRRLRGLLDVVQEARPVLEQTHRPVDDEELLGDVDVLEAVLVGRRDGRARRGVADLVGVLGAVEPDAARGVVVFADDAGSVVLRRVGRRVEAKDSVLADGDLVLADGGPALGLSVRPEAVGRVVLGPGEGAGGRVARAPEDEQALRAEAADRVLGRKSAAVEPKMVIGAAGDSEVPLLRRIRALEHAHRVDELWDDEVRVGVPVAVVVPRVVDGDAIDAELEVLPLVRVEAAQEHLLGVA